MTMTEEIDDCMPAAPSVAAEANYTAGPWRLDDPANAHVIEEYYHCIDAGLGFCGKDDSGFGLAGCMSIENARLIAAAPELYEALKWFIDDIDSTHTRMLDFDANVSRARTALAKARGEQP